MGTTRTATTAICAGSGNCKTNAAPDTARIPKGREMYNFDKEFEEDRELLKENPYAEYPDFPKECLMTDMSQMEPAYC